MLNILITICARGGSKGVKNKNIRMLLGKPLITYSIETAQKWGIAERIVVSTDSKEIAEIALSFGAEVPFLRPDELASDTSPKLSAIRHALIHSEKYFNERFDVVVDLDATAPLRSIKDLDKGFALFQKYQPKTLFSVVPARRNPYFNMVEELEDGKAILCKNLPDSVVRRQDAPKVYNMNASIYFYRRDYVLDIENVNAMSDDTRILVMDEETGFDIDSELDFKLIEFLAREKLRAQ